MTSSENAMLVYLAAAVGARPAEAESFTRKARAVPAQPSEQYLTALGKMLELVQEAGPSKLQGYRQRLLALARDVRVVSRLADDYPMNAAKSALITALDY